MAAMLLLGWAVGTGSTRLDDWFHQYRYGPAKWLLFFTDPRVLAILVLGCMGVALYRRQWQLASAALLAPIVGIAIVRLLKPFFDRHNGPDLAYPSGHTTTMVVVVGMFVLVAGIASWSVLVAVAFCLLGMLGQGATYHYFTDTVGALLLGTAILCVTALALGRAPRRT